MGAHSRRRAKILITGCGRSGTRYTVAVLAKHGLDVRHEQIGRDGAASWCMAVDAERTPWGPPRRECKFEHIYHQMRSPLTAIPSITAMKEASWRYICEWIPCERHEPPLLRSAKYWYYWNIRAEKIAHWRYRIEEFRDIYPEFCDRLGLVADEAVLDGLAKNINTRSHGRLLHLYDELCLRLGLYPIERVREFLSQRDNDLKPNELSWNQLEDLDRKLARLIMAKAAQYGYAVEHQ